MEEKRVDWQLTDTRERMVNDLVSGDTLIGLSKNEIFRLLGQPEISEELRLKYLIRETHEWNIDPEYIKYLWVILDQNKKAIGTKIEVTK